MRMCCKGLVSLIEGPFLEAILNTERDLASCGRGSQPWTREVRGNDCRVLWPGREEHSLQPSAQMPKGEASVPGSKSAKVERRKASAPRQGARRASPARQFLRLSALRRPSFGWLQGSFKTRAPRRRGNERYRADGMGAQRATDRPFRPEQSQRPEAQENQ